LFAVNYSISVGLFFVAHKQSYPRCYETWHEKGGEEVEHDFLIYIKEYHRNDGNPICSGDNGYYYAADRKELLASIGQMTSRIREIAKAKRGLVKALEHFPDTNGQLRLDLDKEVRER